MFNRIDEVCLFSEPTQIALYGMCKFVVCGVLVKML